MKLLKRIVSALRGNKHSQARLSMQWDNMNLFAIASDLDMQHETDETKAAEKEMNEEMVDKIRKAGLL